MACKKGPSVTPPPSPNKGTSPTFICHSYNASTPAYNGAGYLTVFDLNHDANKDKKFFIVKFEPGGDSVKVVMQPKPIDSLGSNWPAHVKTACWGFSGDLIVDAHTAISSTYSSQPPGVSFVLDSMKNTPRRIATYNYLNNPAYAGKMVGVKPTAEIFVKTPIDYFGDYNVRHAIIYGKQRVFTSTMAGAEVGDVNNVLISPLSGSSPLGGFDWANVECSVAQSLTAGWRFYFFDFKNWRYFTVQETYHFNPSTTVQNWLYTASAYKSLDTFCKWPEGWKKP